VLAAGDACRPGDTLPAGDRHALTVGGLHRHVGQELEQLVAADPTTVELEEVEQEAWDQSFGDEGAGSSVPRDAGRVEVVLDQPSVRPVGRPDHRHAGERRSGAGGLDELTDGVSNLLVGVGGGHDRDGGCGGWGGGWGGWWGGWWGGGWGGWWGGGWIGRSEIDAERTRERRDLGVDVGDAGPFEEHVQVGPGTDRTEQRGGQPPIGAREEGHRAIEERGTLVDALDRQGEQIAFVVPAVGEALAHHRRHACGLGRPTARGTQRGQRVRPGDAELAVQVAQARHGRGVVGDGRVVARRVSQHLSDGDVDERCRDRTSARRCQLGAREALGEPGGSDEIDRGHTAVRPEPPAGHDPDGVGGHDDGDVGERVPALRLPDRLGQRRQRVGGGNSGAPDGHGRRS
jgi:hypothetical protein